MRHHQDNHVILDFSAVVHHCLHSGTCENQEPDENGRMINSAEHGFGVFLDEYLSPILQDCSPRQIIAAHDGGTLYREHVFPGYKAKRKERKKAEEASRSAVEFGKLSRWLKLLLASLGATQCLVDGVEGDDLIGFLVTLPGLKRVHTVDADMMQLASDTVTIYLKNAPIDPANPDSQYATKFSLMLHECCGPNWPRYVALAKSLIGDTSDEYIGVKGFGETMFADLVREVGVDGLDELIHCVDNRRFGPLEDAIKAYEAEGKVPRFLNMLWEHRAEWRQGWVLANLHPELCVYPYRSKITTIQWYKRVPSVTQLTQVLKSTGYGHWHEELSQYCPTYQLIDSTNFDDNFLLKFDQWVKASPAIAFDYESWDDNHPQFKEASTTGVHVDVPHSNMSGVSFALGSNYQHCFYIPTDHKDSNNLPKDVVAELLKRIPRNKPIVAHNSQFEVGLTLAELGFHLEDVHDTMIMSNYVDENERAGLKMCSKRELNYNQTSYEEVIAQAGFEGATMKDLTAMQVLSYGIDDSVVTGHLYDLYKLRMQLEQTWDFYAEYEPGTTNTLAHGHHQGVRVDWDALQELHDKDAEAVRFHHNAFRELVAEHCRTVSEDALAHFVAMERQAWGTQLRAKLDAMPPEALQAEAKRHGLEANDKDGLIKAGIETFAQTMRDLATYEDYRETLVVPEFKPTKTQFKRITEQLGFEQPLAVDSMKGIREWIKAHSTFDLESGATGDLDPKQTKFVELLGGAVTTFKAREGSAYNRFVEFCQAHAPAEGRLVKSGSELSFNSPKQLQAMLYVMLGAKVRLRTPPQMGSFRSKFSLDGAPATDESALDTALAEDFTEEDWQYDAINHIKKAKTAQTRIGLYHKPYPLWRHPDEDGLIYPGIRNFGTVTGRPSGSQPNILQVSKHQDKGIMRSVFLPRYIDCEKLLDRHLLVAIDFAGQELRILASRTKDPNLLSAYIGEANTKRYLEDQSLQWSSEEVEQCDDLRDIHSMTASGMTTIFGLPRMNYEEYLAALEEEDHEHHEGATKIRKKPAKTTNFLLAYGGTPPALARKLIIKEVMATKMMNTTLKLYSGLPKWQEESAAFGRRHGFTLTAYGKRRHLSNDIFSKDGGKRSRMERQCANAEIQGTAADILKVVLSTAWKRQLWQRLGAICVAPVYDEVVASVPIRHIIEYISEMRDIMNLTPPGQPVPMIADVSLGHNWQKQIELGTNPTEAEIQAAIDKAVEAQNG